MKYPIYNKYDEIICYIQIDKSELPRIKKYNWRLMGRGYIKARVDGKDTYLHRFVMNQTNPKIVIDHINGDILDNRKSNLREASRRDNAFNRRKTYNPNSSQYKGVSFDKSRGKWQAYFKIYQKKYLIGHFDNEKEAAKQYDYYAKKVFGKFARTNF